MKIIELTANYIQTISWFDNKIVDWGSAAQQYSLDGNIKQLWKYHYTYNFNGSINSLDGTYAFIYQKNGTKGLLLKEGELLREINRSYYCANVYEYPAAFVTVDDKTYLIHCPISYNQLDFEDVETGELVTNIPSRGPGDFFHSRLEISPNGTYLLDKGWIWHPLDAVQIYNIKDCLNDPKLLDGYHCLQQYWDAEIRTASFIDDNRILIGTSNELMDDEGRDDKIISLPTKSIAVYNIETKQYSTPVKIDYEFGNLFAISNEFAWDMYQYPKIINIITGEIEDKAEDIDSGKQRSAIFNHTDKFPQISFNPKTKSIAVTGNEKVYVLSSLVH